MAMDRRGFLSALLASAFAPKLPALDEKPVQVSGARVLAGGVRLPSVLTIEGPSFRSEICDVTWHGSKEYRAKPNPYSKLRLEVLDTPDLPDLPVGCTERIDIHAGLHTLTFDAEVMNVEPGRRDYAFPATIWYTLLVSSITIHPMAIETA